MSTPQPAATPPGAAEFEFAALDKAAHYRRWIAREFAPHLAGRVLEIGAGVGHFTHFFAALPAVREVVAVEPEEEYCRTLRRTLPPANVIAGTIDAVAERATWDAIVCINVLEHIADDRAELRKFFDHLVARRGTLCLFVPARPEIYAPIDRCFGHHRRYRRPELREKLAAAGFTVRQLHYCNLPGYFIWWLGFRLLRSTTFNPACVALNDRLCIPLTAFLERRLCRPPFGQSLLAVATADPAVDPAVDPA